MELTARRRWWGLALLAVAAFTYVTSESFPVGLLPEISTDLRVSDSTVGYLLTIYAAAVAVSVVPFVIVTTRVARRRLIIITVVMLGISNVAMAVAPSYGVLAAARLLSATTHGIFWSVIAPTAAALVTRDREGGRRRPCSLGILSRWCSEHPSSPFSGTPSDGGRPPRSSVALRSVRRSESDSLCRGCPFLPRTP